MRKRDGTFAKGSNMRKTHGKRLSRAYSIYRNMRTRCENPKCEFYGDYGGRGITICSEWSTFEGFYADMGDPPNEATIERIDNDKGYAPNNCRWATRAEQSRNRRGRRMVTAHGELRTVAEWAALTGIGMSTILFRLKSGWAEEDSVSIPARKMTRLTAEIAARIRADGRLQSEIAKDYGISQGMVSLVKNNRVWSDPAERRAA